MIEGLPRPDPTYATHFPVLAAVVARTTGAVAEVGSGQFSTPLLETLVHPPRRWATFETSPTWISNLRIPRLSNHQIIPVRPNEVPDLTGYEVAFIDGEVPAFRADIALGCGAHILIMHDANPDWEPTYHYRDRLRSRFKFHAFYGRLRPWTMILSNHVDPFDLLPPSTLFQE